MRLPAWAHPWDVALVTVLVALAEVELTLPWDDGFRGGSYGVAALVAATLVGALVLRRNRPGPALAVMWLAVLVPGVFSAVTVLFLGGFVPLLVMTTACARRDPGWMGRWAWAGGAVFQVSQIHQPSVWTVSDLSFDLGLVAAAWLVGRGLRLTDRRRAELSEAVAALEARRAWAASEARRLERGRIASEMHDVVGHAVSLMVLQVGAARAQLEAAGSAPPTAVDRLRAAESAGRESLDELRSVLGRLRSPGGPS